MKNDKKMSCRTYNLTRFDCIRATAGRFNYQSDKYNQTTATSEKIVVTYVADNSFEVKQDAEKQITVTFDAPVKALTRDDVVINRLYKGFELPVLVNKVTLAEDGMSATVTLFTALLDKNEYVVNIAGYEATDLTASIGEPVEVLLFVDEKTKNDPGELVYIDGVSNVVELGFRLIDANGVDVTETAKKNGTLFVTAEVSPEYKYFVTDNTIWFADENVEVVVNAEFQVYDNVTGTLVSPAKGQKLFISQKEADAQVIGVVDWKIGGTWDEPKKSLPLDETATLELKLGLTKGDPLPIDAENMLGFTVGKTTGWIRFEELNANVAAMDGNVIKYFKQDVAKILVYYCYEEVDGTLVELPLYQVNAQAKAAKKLATANLSQQTLTIGTVAGDENENFDKATITISAKDNYTNDFSAYKVEVTGNDDKTKAVLLADPTAVVVGTNTIDFYGAKLKAATEGTPATAQLNFKVTITAGDVKIEKTVTVVYKSEGTVLTKRIEANGFGVDVARTAKDDASKVEKTATFTVYQYSNGIKVDTVNVEKFDANNITDGTFYFKVTKDNKDITDSADISVENGVITLKFSGVGDDNVVTYALGAGNYAVTLFEGDVVNGKPYPRPVSGASAVGAVTCNVGSYGAADLLVERLEIADLANADDAVIQAAVRDAFSIKNAQNAEATKDAALYTVDYEVTDRYVYVKSFTFLDEVGTNEYAKYTVQVNRAILN